MEIDGARTIIFYVINFFRQKLKEQIAKDREDFKLKHQVTIKIDMTVLYGHRLVI